MGANGAEPIDAPRLPHFAALDGLRAVALLVVLAFHGGFAEVRGGYLPLTAFFVLSGFLITALLLVEHHRSGRISLRAFWARRARRLAPGALLGIGAAAAYVGAVSERGAADFTGDALASASWWMNWRLIGSGRSYEATFAEPSPLQHLWSLSVEEQFYVVLPLLAVGALALGGGRRRWLVAAASALVVASVVAMRTLHHPGEPPLRAYFGTDARAAELLVGVLLATALVRGGTVVRLARRGRAAIDVAGGAALVASIGLWFRTQEYDDRLYEGGLLGIALLAALVVAAATQPGTAVARVLGARPLAAYGRISYGVYLFHWPIFLWLDEARTGLTTVPLFALRMAATTAAALLSFHLVEQPIRRGRFPSTVGAVAWANGSVAVLAIVAVAAATTPGASTLDVTLGDQRATAPAPAPAVTAPSTTTATSIAAPPSTTEGPTPHVGGSTEAPPSLQPTPPPAPTTEPPTAAPELPPPPLRVMVIGDSIARNLAFGLRSWSQGGAVAVIDDASVPGCPAEGGGLRYMAQEDPWPVPEECSWWRTGARARLDAFAPDVVVVATGLNELFLRTHPSWEGQQALGGGTYDERLRRTYLELIDAFSATGVPIVWLEPPCVRYYRVLYSVEDGEARMAALRSIMAAAAGARGVPVRVLAEPICPAGYSDTVLGVPGARPDGYHIADVASVAVAEQWLGPLLMQAGGR
jgi:peptidoglycan/LPS O-acetylase OafA/YrhL